MYVLHVFLSYPLYGRIPFSDPPLGGGTGADGRASVQRGRGARPRRASRHGGLNSESVVARSLIRCQIAMTYIMYHDI